MWKSITGFVGLVLVSFGCYSADLTSMEMRWLEGIWPVVEYAREADLPLDVVVQPQPTPGESPLAMGFMGGRCKLVLSMRDNPLAQKTLDGIHPELMGPTLELMAAHELGHCRRYVDGAWYTLPARFAAGLAASDAADVAGAADDDAPAPRVAETDARAESDADTLAARREEGYADLVGLAWIRQAYPQHFARLHAWLVEERSRDLPNDSQHNTLAWLRLAVGAPSLVTESIFAGSSVLWEAGLASED